MLVKRAAPRAGAAHTSTEGVKRSAATGKVVSFTTMPMPKTVIVTTEQSGATMIQKLPPQIT